MRNPNGWGSVHKLPGNRRRPWRARITSGWTVDEDGKHRQQYKTIGWYATREEAMTALAEYNANPYEIDDAITFAELYEKWSAEKFPTISDSNVSGYKASYKACADLYNLKFAEIRRAHLQGVVDNCGKAYPTLRKLKVFFGQMYDYAVQNDICDKDYSDFVDIARHKPKNPESIHKPFTPEEITSLWENLPRDPYIGIILMMLYSGVRIGEMCALKKDDVHMAERYFDVKASKTQAGIRKVPIAEITLPLWTHWMNLPGDHVLQKPSGGGMDTNTYREVYFVNLLEKIGQDHLPHDTRHTCVSLLVKAGVDKVLIQRIVGHKGTDVTDNVYTHFEIKQLIDAINKIQV